MSDYITYGQVKCVDRDLVVLESNEGGDGIWLTVENKDGRGVTADMTVHQVEQLYMELKLILSR